MFKKTFKPLAKHLQVFLNTPGFFQQVHVQVPGHVHGHAHEHVQVHVPVPARVHAIGMSM